VTLGGGADKDSGLTEGGVGRDYLLAQGVPLTRIGLFTAGTAAVRVVDAAHETVTIARHGWSHF